MNNIIQKERIYLFSPSANICVDAVIDSIIEENELRKAIDAAVNSHQILCSKVVMQSNGIASFELCEGNREISLEKYSSSWQCVALAQELKAFHIDKGETIRFFYSYKEGKTEILVIAHHIVGDGLSFVLFMEDFLKSLNDCTLPFRPIQLLTYNDLPKHPKLNPIMRMIINRTNQKWKKNGKAFSLEAYEKIFDTYSNNNKTDILVKTINGEQLTQLLHFTHENGITVNSLLVTAFAAADSTSPNIGIAINVRPEKFKGMGNYATGISIKTAYDNRKTFIENAKAIDIAIGKKLKAPASKYFLYEFMNSISPSLIDSMYFSLAGLFENVISAEVSKMCGYVSNPTGTSITNLTNIKIEDNNNGYHYESLFFIPPYVPNVSRVIGASTYKNTLTLSTHFLQRCYENENKIFINAYELILALISNK